MSHSTPMAASRTRRARDAKRHAKRCRRGTRSPCGCCARQQRKARPERERQSGPGRTGQASPPPVAARCARQLQAHGPATRRGRLRRPIATIGEQRVRRGLRVTGPGMEMMAPHGAAQLRSATAKHVRSVNETVLLQRHCSVAAEFEMADRRSFPRGREKGTGRFSCGPLDWLHRK